MTTELDPVAAAKAVLIEVMNLLGFYRKHLVVVGGWVPELLLPDHGHIGSLDVDLAVDVRDIGKDQYDTILQRLTNADYKREATSFRRSVAGAVLPVKLDLITGQYLDESDADHSARFQEIRLGKLRGADLAFEVFEERRLTGKMPDGTENTVTLKIVRIEAFIVMKAFALAERIKKKDAYDIYFCLKHYAGGVAELAKRYRPLSEHGLVREGLALLRDKFKTVHSVGPLWAAELDAENGSDPEIAQRDAFELMQTLLDAIEADGAK